MRRELIVVSVVWFDPFDGVELCGWITRYDRRKGAAAYHTGRIKRLTQAYKSLFAKTLMGRTPKTRTNLYTVRA